ncbi:MAG: IS256 family transposase [Planctomycetota bacterium]
MAEATTIHDIHQAPSSRNAMEEVLREGARRLLQEAIEQEVAAYIDAHAAERDEEGHRLVVRNGRAPVRKIQTGIGPIPVSRPRVDDRRVDVEGNRLRFESSLLPPYLRRSKSIEELLPWLYLKGISTGDFNEALQALVGPDAPGLSATTIVRLKKIWEDDFAAWNKRSLAGKRYVYMWMDGIHCNVRLEDGKPCILVVMGATEDGTKELVAVEDGVRESEQSWKEVLLDLKARGLEAPPELIIADGALGLWKAIPQVWPDARHQRCWFHKSGNVLNKVPKSVQPKMKQALQEIWQAETREAATAAFDLFISKFEAKYPKATACLAKDRVELLAFYDFPAEHWKHLRTTNPIESTFATVRLRTTRTKGAGSRAACLAMVFKLAQAAERKWRKLDGHALLGDIIRGVIFKNGIKVAA